MDAFPNEILEKIVLNLDGVSLVRFKQTCLRFAAVVRQVETELNAWRRRCLVEIPDDVFAEIALAGHVQKSLVTADELNRLSVDWQDVYVRWYGQCCLSNKSVLSKRFIMFDSTPPSNRHRGCSCMKLSGDCLITAHDNGTVHVWDVLTGSRLGGLKSHKRKVVDMALVNVYNSNLDKNVLDIVAHHHMLTVSMDYTMRTVPLIGNRSSPDAVFTYRSRIQVQFTQARIYRDKVALMCSNGKVELFLMQLKSARVDHYLLELLNFRTVAFVSRPNSWMSFWNDKVIVLQPNMDRYCVSVFEPNQPWSCHPSSLLLDQRDPVVRGRFIITACSLYREKISILRSLDSQVYIAVDGIHYRAYSTFKDLDGVVSCCTIKGNLLLLGTDIGNLFLYHFAEEAELIELKLDKPIWTGELSCAISFVDINLDQRNPVLVASDRWSVLVVKWVTNSDSKALKC